MLGDGGLRLFRRIGLQLCLEAVGEPVDELTRDVLDDAAPVLRHRAGERQVGDDVDPGAAASISVRLDWIAACAPPRPRFSRALASA